MSRETDAPCSALCQQRGTMNDRRLAIFTTTSGQTVAINPDFVRCLYGPPMVADGEVQICFADKSAETVEGDIDRVANHLGFELVRSDRGVAQRRIRQEH
jgi:hypothetical protein